MISLLLKPRPTFNSGDSRKLSQIVAITTTPTASAQTGSNYGVIPSSGIESKRSYLDRISIEPIHLYPDNVGYHQLVSCAIRKRRVSDIVTHLKLLLYPRPILSTTVVHNMKSRKFIADVGIGCRHCTFVNHFVGGFSSFHGAKCEPSVDNVGRGPGDGFRDASRTKAFTACTFRVDT